MWVSTLVTSYHTVPASPPCPQCRDEGVPCLRRAAAQPRRPHLGPGRGRGGQTQALAQAEDGEAEGGHDNNNNVQCHPGIRVQDLFWFRTTEDEAGQAACSAVDEASVEIVPGPPGDTCQVQYSTYSTVQYNCNLSPFLTSGGRSEVLFLRQEGGGGDNQLEIYLWNVRVARIVCSIAVCIMFSQVSRQQTLLLQN